MILNIYEDIVIPFYETESLKYYLCGIRETDCKVPVSVEIITWIINIHAKL